MSIRKDVLGKLKIALVYDRVNKWGGAERVLLTLHEMFPKASLYTSVYDKKRAPWAKVFPSIHTSFLQNIPLIRNNHELFGWLMPIAFETFDFSKYDIVISVTSESAKGVIIGTNTLHICYCLTPTRYLWSGYADYFGNKFFKFISRPIINYLRTWDKLAAQRPDKIIAISTEVKRRIEKYYKRDSETIFPPSMLFQKTSIKSTSNKNYFLIVGRLVPYKKVDLVIEAFNDLRLPLVIVGTGSEEDRLKQMAKSNIKFVGQISDDRLVGYYKNARALVMPQFEDFGIVSIEAQSFGIPVIAYGKGGVEDTVINGKTGVLFNKQNKDSLKEAIANYCKIGFNHSYIRENAKRFTKENFKKRLQRSLVRTYSSWRWGN